MRHRVKAQELEGLLGTDIMGDRHDKYNSALHNSNCKTKVTSNENARKRKTHQSAPDYKKNLNRADARASSTTDNYIKRIIGILWAQREIVMIK